MSKLSDIAERIEHKSKAAWGNIVARLEQPEPRDESPKEISDTEQTRMAMGAWASQDIATNAFIPYLNNMIRERNQLSRDHMRNGQGAEAAFESGAEDSLRQLRLDFLYWSGQVATPREGE